MLRSLRHFHGLAKELISQRNPTADGILRLGLQIFFGRFLASYDRVVESAQEMLAYLDDHYAVHPEIKRVITQLSNAARSELF